MAKKQITKPAVYAENEISSIGRLKKVYKIQRMPELTYVFAMQVEITQTLGIKTISAANTGNFYQNYLDG